MGADHYQLMDATAISRFWTLIACLSDFLDQQRAAQDALLTWGDARRALHKEHQLNLLLWVEHQLKTGLSVQQIGVQLAL